MFLTLSSALMRNRTKNDLSVLAAGILALTGISLLLSQPFSRTEFQGLQQELRASLRTTSLLYR